jgi:hypothetical protein
MTSCQELPHIQTPTDNTPPPPLTDVKAESLPGGAKITYKLPDGDNDISYVKAEYIYKDEKRIERTSIYCDSLKIEGLNSIEPLSVNVYVVDHSQNVSAPVSVSFTPDTPPIETIFNSVNLVSDFGGIKVLWTNQTATEIGITVFVEDSLGNMQETDTRFSRDVEGELVFRGFDPIEVRVAIRITDKWGNISELKEIVITPLFEKAIDKTKFAAANLPGDIGTPANFPFNRLFDGDISGTSIWVSETAEAFPIYTSLDLGTTAKLSRFRLWGQPRFWYSNVGFRVFEVWGANEVKRNEPDSYWSSGDWKNDWVKLNDYEVRRPSGGMDPIGSPTGEDLEAAQNGWEFLVPFEKPPCRYIRFIVHTVWSSGMILCMAEVSFWGDDNF